MKKYRIGYAGTPEFAVPAFEALCNDAHYEIVLALTQPDRPAGRGQKLQASPIKKIALAEGIPVWQPITLKNADFISALKELKLDMLIVAAYGLIIPSEVLSIPVFGCLNIHGSLLPRWRGAAPVQRAIEAGDKITGITLMQMDQGLDTGAMFKRRTCEILPKENSGELMMRLAEIGAGLLTEFLPDIFSGSLQAVPQNAEDATYAHKISKAEAQLNWDQPAEILERKIRAFYPFPGCWFEYAGLRIKVGSAELIKLKKNDHKAGTLLMDDPEKDLIILCQENALCLKSIQLAGGKMAAPTKEIKKLLMTPRFNDSIRT